MSGANYNGRQPDNSSYIKTFVEESLTDLWTIIEFSRNQTTASFLSPTSDIPNVFINGDLIVTGQIINTDPGNGNDSNNIQEKLNNLLNLIDNMQKQIDELKARENN